MRRKLRIILLVPVACMLPQVDSGPGEAVVGPALEVRLLAPGVWLHTTRRSVPGGGRIPSNGLIIEDGDSLLLVDTAWGDHETEELLRWTEERLGRPVRAALVTHHHGDRLAGVDLLRDSGIRLVGHPLTEELGDVRGLLRPLLELRETGAAVRFGPAEVFYPGPGHAVDNLVVWLAESSTLFGGCLVRPLESTSLGNVEDADLGQWDQTVERVLERYGSARLVVPGHGVPTGPEVLHHTRNLVAVSRKQAR